MEERRATQWIIKKENRTERHTTCRTPCMRGSTSEGKRRMMNGNSLREKHVSTQRSLILPGGRYALLTSLEPHKGRRKATETVLRFTIRVIGPYSFPFHFVAVAYHWGRPAFFFFFLKSDGATHRKKERRTPRTPTLTHSLSLSFLFSLSRDPCVYVCVCVNSDVQGSTIQLINWTLTIIWFAKRKVYTTQNLLKPLASYDHTSVDAYIHIHTYARKNNNNKKKGSCRQERRRRRGVKGISRHNRHKYKSTHTPKTTTELTLIH